MTQLLPETAITNLETLELPDQHRPRPGDQVFTLDGKRIGSVLEVLGTHFRVQLFGDIAIVSVDSVYSREAEEVTLVCDTWGLHRHLLA